VRVWTYERGAACRAKRAAEKGVVFPDKGLLWGKCEVGVSVLGRADPAVRRLKVQEKIREERQKGYLEASGFLFSFFLFFGGTGV
jgi:hypothetical protein